jgi:tetrahydromethanopterin S-methyltransferase subunit B
MGCCSKKKTFTDLGVFEMMEKNGAYKNIKNYAARQGIGDLRIYSDILVNFRKRYRRHYTKRFLERTGYSSSTTAQKMTVDNDELVLYLNGIPVDPVVEGINQTLVSYPYIDSIGRLWLQDNGEMSNDTDVWIDDVDSKTWDVIDFVENDPDDENNTDIDIQLHNDTDGDRVITIDGSMQEVKSLVVIYNSDDTYPANEWWVYIEDYDTVPEDVFIKTDIELSAVVTLKKDGVVNDTEERNLKRMLNKLGLSGKDLKQQLEDNTDIDNSYLMTGIPIDATSLGSIEAMYKMFDSIAINDGDGSYVFKMNELEFTYNFDIVSRIVDGTITTPRDRYEKIIETINGDPPIENSVGSGYRNGRMYLRHQFSDTQYKELEITNFIMDYTISGHLFSFSLFSTPIDTEDKETDTRCRLIIPLDIYEDLKFQRWMEMYEDSFSMISYSIEVVEIEWYQTKWGQFLIALTLSLITGGLAGMAMYEILSQFAINYAISTLLQMGLSMIDDPMIRAVAGAIAGFLLGGMVAGGFNMNNMFNVDNMLPMATDILKASDNIMNAKVAKDAEDAKEQIKEMKEQDEEIEEKLKEMEGNPYNVWLNSIFARNGTNSMAGMTSPDAFYSTALGEQLHEYDAYYNIDGAISTRVEVISGF